MNDTAEIRALKGARLMLYAWRGSRRKDGYGPHPELDDTIREIEEILLRIKEPV